MQVSHCTLSALPTHPAGARSVAPHWDNCIAFLAPGAMHSMGNREGIRTTATIATGWRSNDKLKHSVFLATLCCLLHLFVSLSHPQRGLVLLLRVGNSISVRVPTAMWSRFPLIICPRIQAVSGVCVCSHDLLHLSSSSAMVSME